MSALTNYENFLKVTNKSIGFIMAFVQYQLYLNRLHYAENEFVDSTLVTVCKNRYISSHSIFFCIALLLLTESQKTYILLFIETKRAQVCCVANFTPYRRNIYGHKENPLQNLLERR